MRRADRLFQIAQHLKARRLTTAAQLSAMLGVSERTIYRDVRDLSLSGIPIRGEAGVGYSMDRSFELTALMFTRDEVEAVVVGLRMVQAFAGPTLRAAATPALDKIILALPKGRRDEIERPQMYVPPVQSRGDVDSVIETIRAAIDGHLVLRMTYADAAGAPTERLIRPLAMHFWGSVWTLAAWCEFRKDFRSFRLDRVRACAHTGSLFVEEHGKTLGDYLRSVRGDSATR